MTTSSPVREPSQDVAAILRDIDAVDWSRLRHLRGPATDVPVLLRGLSDRDDETWRHAMRVLGTRVLPFYDGIDGAVCEVTSHVIPFLARLASADVPSTADILVFLRRIATVAWDQDPYLARPGPSAAAVARRVLIRSSSPVLPKSALLPFVRALHAGRDAAAALFRHFDPVAAELLYGRRAHEALAQCLPDLFVLLGHSSDDVRASAARLVERLAQSAARPDDLSLRIVAHLESERAEVVLAHLIFALGHVGDHPARTLLEALLEVQDVWVRVLSAISLAPRPLEASPRGRVSVLVSVLAEPEPIAERYVTATGRALDADVSRSLLLHDRDRAEVSAQLLAVLADSRGREVPVPVFDVLLEVMFPDAAGPLSPGALSREQRMVLHRLGAAEGRLRARDRDFSAKLAAKGLPTDSKELSRFVMMN